MIPDDLFDAYPGFYGNPVIGALADSPRWTVSDRDKMPLDIRELAAAGTVRGAHAKTVECLMTLEELTAFLPTAANHAFALDAHIDEVAVLDIEPACPPDLARDLLRIPTLYAETSMSGRGYHLVLPLPEGFYDFPAATGKPKLQEGHRWYEILITHWVTFTRNPIPDPLPEPDPDLARWAALYRDLAVKVVQTRAVHVDVTLKRPDIPGADQALPLMLREPPPKTLDDFCGDRSRYEFSVLSVLNHRLDPMLPYLQERYETAYTPQMRAWLLYDAASQILPHRDKHDQRRHGMPYLLDRAATMVALSDARHRDADDHNAA